MWGEVEASPEDKAFFSGQHSPFSVRRRKESLRRRRRLKPPFISSLPGDPGIMLVCKAKQLFHLGKRQDARRKNGSREHHVGRGWGGGIAQAPGAPAEPLTSRRLKVISRLDQK